MMNHNSFFFCVSKSKLLWSVARGECNEINGILWLIFHNEKKLSLKMGEWTREARKKLAAVCVELVDGWTLKVWWNNRFRTGNHRNWQGARHKCRTSNVALIFGPVLTDSTFALINGKELFFMLRFYVCWPYDKLCNCFS